MIASIGNKLFRLSAALMGKSLLDESLAVKKIIKSSSDKTFVINDDTFVINDGGETSDAVAPGARALPYTLLEQIGPSRYMDRLLRDMGATPIRYMGGRSAKYSEDRDLIRSKWGDLYEVLFGGQVSVAKIIRQGDKENVIWERIANANFESEVMTHLPVIRAIENFGDYNIIIMEKLGRLSPHIKKVFKEQGYRGRSDVLKSEEFIHDMVSRSVDDALVLMSNDPGLEPYDEEAELYGEEASDLVAKYLNTVFSDRGAVVSGIESDIFNNNFDLYDPITFRAELPKKIMYYLSRVNMGSGNSGYNLRAVTEELALKISGQMGSYMRTPSRAIPKYYLSTDATSEYDPDEDTYEGTPEGFLYTQSYMPETKSLFAAMIKLKEANIIWQDLHLNNLMQRAESNDHGEPGDLVIIDVGLYGTEEENRAM